MVPNIAAGRLEKMFDAAGWQVLTVKLGTLLESLFARPGQYQRLLRCTPEQVRDRLPGDGTDRDEIADLIDELDGPTLAAATRNLGGHDMAALIEAYRQIDDIRPTVIIAYTIKGYGLPTERHPKNHSSLMCRGIPTIRRTSGS